MNQELITKTQANSDRLLAHTLATIARMVADGVEVSYASVAREAQVSRPYLYRHPEIREKIDACRVSKMTKDELRKEVVRLRATIK